MLGLLRRHEVETLLKAGHKRYEIVRVTGISLSSVRRIAREPTVEHLDDTAERRARRIGRPSNIEAFRNAIKHILGTDPDMPTLDVLRQVQKAGYTGGKSAPYNLVALLRPIEPATKRNEAFQWMRAVQQGGHPHPTLEKELGHVTDSRKLLKGTCNCATGRRRSVRKRWPFPSVSEGLSAP